jgi:hypothetical protein
MKRYLFPLLMILAIAVGQSDAATIRADASPLLAPGLIEVGAPFTVDIYMNNNDGVDHMGYSMPLVFYSPDESITNTQHRNVQGYSAGIPGTWPLVLLNDSSILILNNFEMYWNFWNAFYGFDWDGILPDTLNHTAASTGGWPPGLGEQLNIQMAYQIDEEGTFCVDSCSIPNVEPPGKYDWLFDHPTTFGGPYCWEVGTLPEDPEIGVDPDSFYFESVLGQPPPPAQILHITNTGIGTLNWTASWNSAWLSVTPPFGTAPSNVQIFANVSGLGVGTYSDTITIADPNAINSPVLIPVELKVMEPPPEIELSQTYFSFNAIADSTDPPDQVLAVSNSGGGTLNWTASNSESWLDIVPTSGTDYGEITLSVTIAGLPYGVYYDTVVVSDPNASNDPQKAAVRLEIASSLPIIAVDPSIVYVIVDLDEPVPDDKVFLIYNDGAGSMNYYLEESSPRIASLEPDSESVPQMVVAHFDSVQCVDQQLFFDTVWVHSMEAINSPQPVEFRFMCYTDPAVILLNYDSIVANLYECGQGATIPPTHYVTIYNGGQEPFTFDLSYSSDWLQPSMTSSPAPGKVYLNFDYQSMAPGTYYDTVVVTANEAINSPQYLPVTLNILPTDETPEILVSMNNISLDAQIGKTGRDRFTSINNKNPGCMDWEIQDDISWADFYPSQDFGYPWLVNIVPNGLGMTMGHYYDTAYVTSESASNSPYPIYLNIQIWMFHGDCDYNGTINLLDVRYLIDYLYREGPAPLPSIAVGDCDCDTYINLVDGKLIIDYLYRNGPPLCGNPY